MKILLILFCFVSVSALGQNGKDKFGKYVFWDTVYFKRVPYNSGGGVVHLGIDTVAGSPTYGKLVRKTAGSGTTVSLNKTKTIEFPTATENTTLWQTPVDITISSVYAVSVGSSPSVTFQISFGSDRTSATNVYSSGRTTTSTTTGDTFSSSFNDATIPAGSWIWITTSAQSGTVTELAIQINYTED